MAMQNQWTVLIELHLPSSPLQPSLLMFLWWPIRTQLPSKTMPSKTGPANQILALHLTTSSFLNVRPARRASSGVTASPTQNVPLSKAHLSTQRMCLAPPHALTPPPLLSFWAGRPNLPSVPPVAHSLSRSPPLSLLVSPLPFRHGSRLTFSDSIGPSALHQSHRHLLLSRPNPRICRIPTPMTIRGVIRCNRSSSLAGHHCQE